MVDRTVTSYHVACGPWVMTAAPERRTGASGASTGFSSAAPSEDIFQMDEAPQSSDDESQRSDDSFTTVATSFANHHGSAMAIAHQLGTQLRPILAATLHSSTASLPEHMQAPFLDEGVVSPDDSISRVGGYGCGGSTVVSTAVPVQEHGRSRLPLSSLSARDVSQLLHSIDLGRYARSLSELPLRGVDLEAADDSDLKEAGVITPVHRRSLLKQVESWRLNGVPRGLVRSNDGNEPPSPHAPSETSSTALLSPISSASCSTSGGWDRMASSGSMATSAFGPSRASSSFISGGSLVSSACSELGTSPASSVGSSAAAQMMDSGHRANIQGDAAEARHCFRTAFELTHAPSAGISAANMLLRLGRAAESLREYEALLLRSDLTEAHRRTVHRKITEAMQLARAMDGVATAMQGSAAFAASVEEAEAGCTSLIDGVDPIALHAAIRAARAANAPEHMLDEARVLLEAARRRTEDQRRHEAEQQYKREAEERASRKAEEDLRAAFPGWFAQPDSGRLRSAIEAAKAAGVAMAHVGAAEAQLSEMVAKEATATRKGAEKQLDESTIDSPIGSPASVCAAEGPSPSLRAAIAVAQAGASDETLEQRELVLGLVKKGAEADGRAEASESSTEASAVSATDVTDDRVMGDKHPLPPDPSLKPCGTSAVEWVGALWADAKVPDEPRLVLTSAARALNRRVALAFAVFAHQQPSGRPRRPRQRMHVMAAVCAVMALLCAAPPGIALRSAATPPPLHVSVVPYHTRPQTWPDGIKSAGWRTWPARWLRKLQDCVRRRRAAVDEKRMAEAALPRRGFLRSLTWAAQR